jgi:Xaa-Pro aminopeptidase
MHETQRQRTRDLLREEGLERALFSHLDSVKWLTGYAPQVQLGGNHFAGGPALVWYEDGHFTLVVLDIDAEHAGAFGDEPDGTLLTYPGYAVEEPVRSPEHIATALGTLTGSASGPIGVEMHSLPAHLYEIVQAAGDPVAIDGRLVPLRMVKSEEEIALLRRNFELSDLGHRVAAVTTRPGLREIDVWTAIHSAINREAGFRVPLGNDCVVGYRDPNNVGGWPKDLEIKGDTALIVDLSTAYGGYWSDSCNVYYATEPTERQIGIHRVIEETLVFAISLIRPGVPCRDVDGKVRAFVEKRGYPVYPHHTGHGVGVSVHEEPRITPYNDTPLEEGMVIMLEPGIYFPGETSCRLEHGLLVTKDGAEVLTSHIDPL